MRKESRSRTWLIGIVVVALSAIVITVVYRVDVRHDASAQAASLTLDPAQFQGDTRQAYIVAHEHPELLAQLDCYCGCEQHEGHKNLLDCFRTRHGAGCETCVGEAVAAGQLADRGMPVDQIRQALRERYSHGS